MKKYRNKKGQMCMNRMFKRMVTLMLALMLVLTILPAPVAQAATMKRGSSGSEVRSLQENLIGLGYLTGSADGSFGPGTEKAVRKFQAEYGLAVDGSAGNATQTAVRNAVVRLQVELKRLGFNPGSADGYFGSKTRSALKAYQSARGLKVTGVADQATWSKINAESGGMLAGTTVPRGSSGTQVKYLQQALIGFGFLSGSADGKYGAQTTEAVRQFQSAYGLSVDGSAGPDTMTSLRNATSTLQSDLSRKGWYTSAIDGIYGNGTRSAVKAYQQYVGLSATGIAGSKTMQKLYGYSLGGRDGADEKTYKTWIDSLYQTGDYRVIYRKNNVEKTVASSGCAGVCVAMAINALKKTSAYDGYSVMKWFVEHDFYQGNGTFHQGLFDYPREVGLRAVACNTPSEMIGHLKLNRLAIVLVEDKTGDEMFVHSRSDGHYVLVSGYRVRNGVKQVYVNNPLSNKRSGWCDLDDLMDNAKDRSYVIVYK